MEIRASRLAGIFLIRLQFIERLILDKADYSSALGLLYTLRKCRLFSYFRLSQVSVKCIDLVYAAFTLQCKVAWLGMMQLCTSAKLRKRITLYCKSVNQLYTLAA
jgi:hypothetical protein